MRWVDDGFNTSHTHNGIRTWCNYMDQDALKETLVNVGVGEPV